MRSLLLSLFVVLTATACPALLAPQPSAGASASSPCSSDFECASGLACECGVCAEPSGQPPRCIDLDDACDDTPSDCFLACGDLSVVSQAQCVGGRETCGGDGVLRSQCDADTCWGELQPGEICLDGQFQCEFPPRLPDGQCLTFECDQALAGECVNACGDGSAPVSQTCIGDEWQCETGIPVEECGECVGVAPSCLSSCGDPTTVGNAACDGTVLEWSCAHIVLNGTPASLSTDCCLPDTVVNSLAAVQSLEGVTCVEGTLTIGSLMGSFLLLDDLELITEDLIVASDTLTGIRLPSLTSIGRSLLVEGNPLLDSVDLPALDSVGSGFYFVSNPALPTCDVLDLLERVEANGNVPLVQVTGNAVCGDGGPQSDDAGTPDGGNLADSGTEDSGMSPDGGAVDAGDGGSDAG